MPLIENSSFDRGYDLRHANAPQKRAALLGRDSTPRVSSEAWRKYAAIAMVAIMVTSAFVLLVPLAGNQPQASENPKEAYMLAPGDREVTYTMSHIGESYLKDSSEPAMGKHGSTPGLSEWWPLRTVGYGDTVMHNAFPYSVGYNPNSAKNAFNKILYAGYIMVSFYRFEMDAKNVTTIATGPEQDPKIIPLLKGGPNPDGLDGGTVTFNWYMTYLTSDDCVALEAGTHYASSYYSVTPDDVYFAGAYANDGWYFEHQGTMTVDRLGANKFFNLPATGDLRTEFTTANTGGALEDAFAAHYDAEGNAGAIYDIYACYDYSTDPVEYVLSLDPASTADSLTVRLWGYSWGMDALMMRYMDVTGLMSNYNVWPEDWYLNGTITSTQANITSRMVTFDHMTNWKDYSVFTGAWMMEPVHADWTYGDIGWISRYNDYDAFTGWVPGKSMRAPGSNYYGTLDSVVSGSRIAYWVTPKAWDLVAGEKLEFDLADAFWAVEPYKGVVAEDFVKLTGSTVKVAEVMSHGYWGEMVLGHGPDASLYSSSYYDSDTKTLTYVGPMTFADSDNSMYPSLEQTGSPLTVLAVSEVSNYTIRIVESGPYYTGVAYTLEVTAKNFTGVTVADWNGTVNLEILSGSATLGTASHTYIDAEDGVFTTTITFDAVGTVVVGSEDGGFPLDIFGEITIPGIDIPEFPTLLIPVIGAVAIFVAIRKRKAQ